MKRCILIVVPWLSVIACREKGDADPVGRTAKPKGDVAENDVDSEPGVKLSRAAQAKAGLGITVIAARAVRPELSAYGVLEEDPDASFTVRATVSALHDCFGSPMATLGQRLPRGRDIRQTRAAAAAH